jgi:hypothetical protein
MSNNTNATIHNPSNFKPEDYRLVGVYDTRASFYDGLEDEAREAAEAAQRYFGYDALPCQCQHCGAYARYVGVALHKPSATHIVVGHTCADNRLGLSNSDFKFKALRQSAAAVRERQRRDAAFIALADTDAELHDALEAALEDADVNNWAKVKDRECALLDVAVATLEGDEVTKAIARGVRILGDIAVRARKYDWKVSDAQRALLISGLTKSREFAAANLQRLRERASSAAALKANLATLAVLEGRVTITAEVLSFKDRETDFGTTRKYLVRLDDQRKVWTSLPADLTSLWAVQEPEAYRAAYEALYAKPDATKDLLTGRKVTFVVTVERTEDAGFYFGSRPCLTPADKKALKAAQAV